jgi:sulfite exporter TauE/SafE
LQESFDPSQGIAGHEGPSAWARQFPKALSWSLLMSSSTIYPILLLSGLLGSLGHCLGMCGPLVLMLGIQLRAQGGGAFPKHLLYHLSRVAVYVLLGAVVGGAGSLLGFGGPLGQVAGIVSLLLGVAVVLLGLGYLGWVPFRRAGSTGDWLNRAMGRALRLRGVLGVVLLGALNGLLPCGLVYSGLLVSATAGGPAAGALGMLAFGLGTMPALLVVGVGGGALSARLRQILARVAGVFLVLVGAQLILRGLAALAVVPHLHWGGVMFW